VNAEDIHDFPNLYAKQPLILGDSEKAMLEADVVVENRFATQRQPHLVIEPETALSYIDEEGRVTVQSKCLDIAIASYSLPKGIGVPPEKLRMIQNNTGASFGYAATPYTLALMAVAAIATEKPCALTLSYEEHQHYTGKRMPSFANYRLGANKNGEFVSMEADILYDNGAYTELTVGILKGIVFTGMPYYFPNATVLAKTAITNHNFTTAFRAFASPQIYAGFEQLVDQMADELGMDPLELRRINVLKEGQLAKTGHPMEAYPMTTLIDNMKPKYLEAKERAKRESTPEKKRGVGISCGVYHASLGPADRAEAAIELNEDGSVTCFNTWSDQGQGGDVGALIHTHEAVRPLGLSPEQIHLVMNDTATCPESGGAYSSRSNVMIGNAILDAAKQLLGAMKKEDGSYRTYEEMKREEIPTKYLGVFDLAGKANLTGIDPNDGHGNFFLMYTYGLFMSEVEVDTLTGRVKVLSVSMEDDVGVVTNPQSLEGQAYGGFAQGIGLALSEDYDDVNKHTNLLSSGVPTIDMVPDELHVHHNITPREYGPHGSGGAAELYLTSPHASILNAIHDACNIRIRELPARPSKILEELRKQKEGIEETFEPYRLGQMSFREEIQEIIDNPV
jgi:aldehyde oxidoreductase